MIKINIHEIEFDGEKFPLVLGSLTALYKYQKETGGNIDGRLLKELAEDFSKLESLFFHCLEVGHIHAKKEFKLKREEFTIFFDYNAATFLNMIVDELIPVKKEEDNSKKKQEKK